jgi:hypothetical protein
MNPRNSRAGVSAIKSWRRLVPAICLIVLTACHRRAQVLLNRQEHAGNDADRSIITPTPEASPDGRSGPHAGGWLPREQN